MATLKILIVEDNLITVEGLREKLLSFGYSITEAAADSREALHAFRRRLPDLVICDITLKNSELDGIATASAMLRIADVPIIFLSAMDDAVTLERAKQIQPAYYLVKPCNATQLQIAIDFAIANYSEKKEADPLHSQTAHKPTPCRFFNAEDYFFVKSGHAYVRISLQNIVWVEAMASNVKIVTEDATHILSANLISFSRQVAHPSLVRVHRSFIVNTEKVLSIFNGGTTVSYKGGQKEIPIGAKYRNEFHKQFKKLISD